MKIPFDKMNGAGNDFVMIDNRDGRFRFSAEAIQGICERRRGVGADGVILIESAPEVDFRMRYYNADGGEAEMCGNGARCAARFAGKLGLGARSDDGVHMSFVASPGRMEAHIDGERVAISMTDATSFEQGICLEVAQGEEIVHFINTGVPHAVVVTGDAAAMDDEEVVRRGRAIRTHGRFAPDGANANFVTVGSDGTVNIRTYERGVEDETLACGTGAVAASVVLAHLGKTDTPVRLLTHGGEALAVSFVRESSGASRVVLEGPAELNFEGVVELSTEV